MQECREFPDIAKFTTNLLSGTLLTRKQHIP